jgi:hypothetical protein
VLGLKLAAELLTRDGMAAASDQACAQQLCCLDVDADVPDLPHGNQVDIGSGMLLQQDGKGKAARKGGRKIRKAVPRPSICTAYSKSSAAALYMVADALGWKVHSTQEQNCSLYWVATKEQLEQRMLTLRAGQVVARIPGMHQFSQKCSFTRLMNLGQELFPGRFSFYPTSWILPQDMARMQIELEGSSASFIVKPDDGAQGDGIFIAPSYKDLLSRLRTVTPNSEVVVQKYIEHPMLLDGLKFDLRVYVFIASLQPLEVWVCREGLARFCTEPYEKPSSKVDAKLTDMCCMHTASMRACTKPQTTNPQPATRKPLVLH